MLGAEARYVSHYVRPALLPVPGGGTRLVFDNGVTGRTETLSPIEERLLRTLWPPAAELDSELVAIALEHGEAALEEGFAGLTQRRILFASSAECEDALTQHMGTMVPLTPLVDQVELTTHCPMRCGFCPRGVEGALRRPRAHASLELFEGLLDQLSPDQVTYRPLELDLLGEALVHPEVDRFVAAAARRGLPTELSVNPSLLNPALAARLLDAGLSRLVISLDAMDDATLKAVRGPAASYTTAERNLRSLFALARERAAPPSIVIQMIDLQRTRPMQKAFLETWGNTGEPFVQAYVKPLDGPDPDTGKPNPQPVRYLCVYPFVSVSVLNDGSVVPCCRDAQGEYVLGNLNEHSLQRIWSSPRAQALRAAHLSGDLDRHPLCGSCPWQRNTFRAAMAERHPDSAPLEPLHG